MASSDPIARAMRAEVRLCARIAFDAASKDLLKGMKEAPARPRVAGKAIPKCNGALRAGLRLTNRTITGNPLKVELEQVSPGGFDYPEFLNSRHKGFSEVTASVRKYYAKCGFSIPAPGSNWQGWFDEWLDEERYCAALAVRFAQAGAPVTVSR